METERICPNCRKPLAPGAPLGLCPECLLKSGLNTGPEPAVEDTQTSGFVPPTVPELTKLFPQLEVLEFIGKGGMGAVYKARQPSLDRFVALKILPPAAAGDAGFAERFNREARALARLSHPNIVTVHDFGQAGPLHYLTMEFVDGGNLRQIEQAGRLAPEQALAIVPQICEALQFAHNEGIVHRDIKPENILLDKKGRVKITDFGIAKILGLSPERAPLTGARDVVGTPHYMAPEQIEKPRTVDHRADIYSLGVVFYEMLTGELPLGRFAPPSRKVQVDVRLDEVVLHALEKEPQLRYQQASQVKTAVENISHSTIADPGAPPKPDPAKLERELLSRDYTLDIGRCVSRGWKLVRSDFWPTVGITAVVTIMLTAVSSIGEASRTVGNFHFNTSVLGFFLAGPFMGGLYFYYLSRIRGLPVKVETAFAGFGKSLLHLVLASFVCTLLTGLGFICLLLPGIYLVVAWKFTVPLIMDKGLEFWPAMQMSRKVITRHWWSFLLLTITFGFLNLAGLLCCFVGVLVSVPVTIASLMYAYEDIINPPPESPASQEPTPAQTARGGWVLGTLAAVLIAALLLFIGFSHFGVRHDRTTAPKTPAALTGAGLYLTRDQQTHQFVIQRVFPNSSAAKAGITPGMVLYKVNGTLAEEKNIEDLSRMLQTPVGTTVTLELVDSKADTNKTVELTREPFENRSP